MTQTHAEPRPSRGIAIAPGTRANLASGQAMCQTAQHPWMTSPRRAAPISGYRHCSGNSCKLDMGPASSSIYLSLGLETDFNDEGDVGNRGRSYPVASIGLHVGRQFDKIWLGPDGRKRHQNQDPIRDGQAAKKMAKNRLTLHLEPQNPSVFSGKNTG